MAVNAKLFYIVVVHLADYSRLATGTQEVVIVESKEHAIFSCVNVGFYVPVTQINRTLESRHRVFWRITGAAAVGKGNRVCRLYEGMGHRES